MYTFVNVINTVNRFSVDRRPSSSATTQDNLDDKLRKFEIRDMMGLTDDRDISETVSETWSTDVLGSDFDPNMDEDRLQEIAGTAQRFTTACVNFYCVHRLVLCKRGFDAASTVWYEAAFTGSDEEFKFSSCFYILSYLWSHCPLCFMVLTLMANCHCASISSAATCAERTQRDNS